MRRTIEKVLDVLANLGFVMRDTRRAKVTAGRLWGKEAEGYVLSIHPVQPLGTLSVALKSTRTVERRASLPPWLSYYAVKLTAPDGSEAHRTAFGGQVMSGGQGLQAAQAVFPPETPVVTEIPLATLYDMRAAGEYRVYVTCLAPGGHETLTSNELKIVI